MSRRGERSAIEFDESETAYGPDFEIETFDETPIDEPALSDYGKTAWQRVEQCAESRWLREQLSDWDDWDVYPDTR